MDPAARLSRNLAREAEAYGYTLAVWGGGGVLLYQFGPPTLLLVVGYVGGALLGYAVLAVSVFQGLFQPVGSEDERQEMAIATVHVVGSFLNVLLSYVLVLVVQSAGLRPAVGAVLVGTHVTITYNLGLVTEQWVARLLG